MPVHGAISFVVASLVPLAACSDSAAASAQMASAAPMSAGAIETAVSPDDPPIVSPTLQRALPVAFTLPRVVAANVHLSRGMIVEAVYFATGTTGAAQLGQITKTGTVTVAASGATYAPAPADRLVVKLGKETHELVVLEAQGNTQAETASAWLASPHVLRYTHKIPAAEVEITSKFDGTRFEAKVKGFAKIGEQRYDVNLTAAGATQSQRDFDGHENQTRYELTGAIRGEGFDVAVNEKHVLESAGSYSLRLLTTQRGSASKLDTRIASVLSCDGSKYAFSGVEVRTEWSDKGNQQKSGTTGIAGSVLRDGAALAVLALQDGAVIAQVGTLSIRLDDVAAR